jgi:hypothetical protein
MDRNCDLEIVYGVADDYNCTFDPISGECSIYDAMEQKILYYGTLSRELERGKFDMHIHHMNEDVLQDIEPMDCIEIIWDMCLNCKEYAIIENINEIIIPCSNCARDYNYLWNGIRCMGLPDLELSPSCPRPW